jgi:hypothetical protein
MLTCSLPLPPRVCTFCDAYLQFAMERPLPPSVCTDCYQVVETAALPLLQGFFSQLYTYNRKELSVETGIHCAEHA